MAGVKALPDGLDERDIRLSLAEHWDFVADTVEYFPEGFGSYHWIAPDADGARRFVTVDDLDTKSWLGNTRDAAFEGLHTAFDVASTLRHRAKLSFVVAPLQTRDEQTLVRLDERHTISAYPIAPGASGDFGDRPTSHQRRRIIEMLVDLHRATPLVRSTASQCDLSIPGRDVLTDTISDLSRSWDSGPYAKPARAALTHGRPAILRLFPVFDVLADGLAADDDLVITHVEPHLGNVMRDGARSRLSTGTPSALPSPNATSGSSTASPTTNSQRTPRPPVDR